jgi:hypothetical protein
MDYIYQLQCRDQQASSSAKDEEFVDLPSFSTTAVVGEVRYFCVPTGSKLFTSTVMQKFVFMYA